MSALVVGGVLALAASTDAEWKNLVGQKAPEFTVQRWINPPEGNNAEDLRGKVLLVEFWATW
jgi:hypothetical protein